MKSKRIAAAATFVVLFGLGGCKGWIPGPEAPLPSPKTPTSQTILPVEPSVRMGAVCQEDDECWDCNADGNGICGTDLGA